MLYDTHHPELSQPRNGGSTPKTDDSQVYVDYCIVLRTLHRANPTVTFQGSSFLVYVPLLFSSHRAIILF